MATVWITYAWSDNQAGDVDFIAQELEKSGVSVKLDRWTIQAGSRLWEQIEKFIQDPTQCDAWVFFATQNSLGSEPCKEEYAYALDRALKNRGATFPIIGLFPGSVNDALIPAGIKTRLYVSLSDPDWKERIVAATEGRGISTNRPVVLPYEYKIHRNPPGLIYAFVVEVRPRAGTWAPFLAGIPASEHTTVNPIIGRGPQGTIPTLIMTTGSRKGINPDGLWWLMTAQDEATPTLSYYIYCNALPSKLLFGKEGSPTQYLIDPLV